MNSHVSPPEPFPFDQPESWEKWIRRFNRYRTVSSLDEKPNACQVDTLIYCMGDKAEDIFATFKLAPEEAQNFNIVVAKFNDHFKGDTNVIYERARFNRRCQEEGESIDSFITNLHTLAKNCNFRDLHEELIHDRIVVGCTDPKLSLSLQIIPDLTLDGAIRRARQSETIKSQQHLLRSPEHIVVKIQLTIILQSTTLVTTEFADKVRVNT